MDQDPLDWTTEAQERALSAIAPWYDLDFGPLEDDVAMLERLIEPGQSVLELGAGTGRLACALAAHGCRVTAVESSQAMLDIGECAMRERGVEVVRGDMRCLDLARQFDVVLIGLSTFQHLLRRADQLATLRTVARHLAEDGRLIVDWTAPRADDIEPSPQALQLEWVRSTDSGQIVTKQAAQELATVREAGDPLDCASPIAWITYQYDCVESAGRVRRSLARFPLRVNLNAGEMAGLLAESGLRASQWYGSWWLDDAGSGDRLIVIGERAA